MCYRGQTNPNKLPEVEELSWAMKEGGDLEEQNQGGEETSLVEEQSERVTSLVKAQERETSLTASWSYLNKNFLNDLDAKADI